LVCQTPTFFATGTWVRTIPALPIQQVLAVLGAAPEEVPVRARRRARRSRCRFLRGHSCRYGVSARICSPAVARLRQARGPVRWPEPMLAQAALQPPTDAAWAYEIKWDGMRALVRVDGVGVHVRSRRGVDFTARFPELYTLASAA